MVRVLAHPVWQILTLGLLFFAGAVVNADSTQATIDVSANVVAACEAGAGPANGGEVDFGKLDFGSQSVLSRDVIIVGQANNGAIRVKCANSVAYRVLLDGGQHGSAADRYLVNDKGDRIKYMLFTDSSHGVPWNDSTGLSGVGNGQENWLPIYGVIPAQPTPSDGVYTDTIKVTINW